MLCIHRIVFLDKFFDISVVIINMHIHFVMQHASIFWRTLKPAAPMAAGLSPSSVVCLPALWPSVRPFYAFAFAFSPVGLPLSLNSNSTDGGRVNNLAAHYI